MLNVHLLITVFKCIYKSVFFVLSWILSRRAYLGVVYVYLISDWRWTSCCECIVDPPEDGHMGARNM